MPTTATSPAGITLIQRSNTIRMASVASETATVGSEVWPKLDQRPTQPIELDVRRGHAEHAADLAGGHLDSDTDQKSGQYRARDEIGEKAEPDHSRRQDKHARDERAQAGQREPLRRVW